VRIRNLFCRVMVCAIFVLSCVGFAMAQPSNQQQKPIMVLPDDKRPTFAASKRSLYCAGFIQHAPNALPFEIAGAEQEQEQVVYGEADYVYINAGAGQGITEGSLYTVVRPRGQFKSKFSKKSGWLGSYFQEIGVIRIMKVKESVSLAFVEAACDSMVLGDQLRPFENRTSPQLEPEKPVDRFADPTGKANGRIVLARENLELLTKDNIVFIDLGSEDGVNAGDYLTIYRPLGKGKTTFYRDDNVTVSSSGGFESDVFKGGPFSTSSPRVKDANGNGVYGPTTSIPNVENRRPKMPRKIVGEMVILSVQQRTATAVITRIAQEVHTGDYVEVK